MRVLCAVPGLACRPSQIRHVDYGAKRLVIDAYGARSGDNICALVVYLSASLYGGETTQY